MHQDDLLRTETSPQEKPSAVLLTSVARYRQRMETLYLREA